MSTAGNYIIGKHFYFILTVELHLNDTQDISNAQVPYRRCERRIFIIYRVSQKKGNPFSNKFFKETIELKLCFLKIPFYTFD